LYVPSNKKDPAFAFAACNYVYRLRGNNHIRRKKDFNTGLTTTYSGEKVFIVMNDEVIGHTDIPLGEKFTIINDKLKGLKEKDGKVSVGCW